MATRLVQRESVRRLFFFCVGPEGAIIMGNFQRANPTIGAQRVDLAGLEARLAALENIVKIEPDGGVTINCMGKVRIKSAMSVEIEAGTTLVAKSAAGAEVNTSGALTLKTAGVANLQGALIKLNNGGKPLVRVGDPVITPMGPATVPSGATTVLA
jgi:hypothetical protein